MINLYNRSSNIVIETATRSVASCQRRRCIERSRNDARHTTKQQNLERAIAKTHAITDSRRQKNMNTNKTPKRHRGAERRLLVLLVGQKNVTNFDLQIPTLFPTILYAILHF